MEAAATRVPEWLGGTEETADEAVVRKLKAFRAKLATLHDESKAIEPMLKALGDHHTGLEAYLYCAGIGVERGIDAAERIVAAPASNIDADALAAVAC